MSLHAGFRNNSGFIPQELNLVTFDLNTGKISKLNEVIDEKMVDVVVTEVLQVGKKLLKTVKERLIFQAM